MRRLREIVIVVVVAAILVTAGIVYFALADRSSGSNGKRPTPPNSVGPPPDLGSCTSNGTSSSAGNWTTYHGDNVRSGVGDRGAVARASPAWGTPPTLDGLVYAEPLICGDAIFVATENDTVYALNASTGAVGWQRHLGTPVPGSSLPCGDIDPSGITGTPVIDVANRTLYAVAYLASPAPAHHAQFGLNLSTGAVVSQVAADAPGSNISAQQQRGALALSRGIVYVPFGGLDGDCGNYHGYVVGIPESPTGRTMVYQVPTHREGGIWTPGGISVAPDGDLYVSTGNGDSTTTFDYGDAVIELSPALGVLGYFAPKDWPTLNRDDTDLGSTPPVVLPNGDVFQVGKAGEGYVLSASNLGGVGGQLGESPVCRGAYGASAHVGTTVLVACNDGVVAVQVGATNLTVLWRTSSFDAGAPIVTGNIVWSIDTSSSTLLGFNRSTGAPVLSEPIGSSVHFETPAAGPGYVVVAGGDQLYEFTLS